MHSLAAAHQCFGGASARSPSTTTGSAVAVAAAGSVAVVRMLGLRALSNSGSCRIMTNLPSLLLSQHHRRLPRCLHAHLPLCFRYQPGRRRARRSLLLCGVQRRRRHGVQRQALRQYYAQQRAQLGQHVLLRSAVISSIIYCHQQSKEGPNLSCLSLSVMINCCDFSLYLLLGGFCARCLLLGLHTLDFGL